MNTHKAMAMPPEIETFLNLIGHHEHQYISPQITRHVYWVTGESGRRWRLIKSENETHKEKPYIVNVYTSAYKPLAPALRFATGEEMLEYLMEEKEKDRIHARDRMHPPHRTWT